MNKKKIFFVIPDLSHHGGAERVTFSIIKSLDYSIYDVGLVLLQKEGQLLNFLPKEIKIFNLNCTRIRYYLFHFLPLLIKEKPHLVFFCWGELGAYFSPFINFFPKINFVVRETNIVSEYIQRPEIRFFYKFYKNFRTIVAQSEDMKIDLVQNIKIKEEKIQIINNPVDFSFIRSSLQSLEIPDLKQEYKNVLAVGTLAYRKGFDDLIKVFSYLKDNKIFLTLLGDGKDRSLLEDLAKELGVKNIKFKGIVNNPYIYYAKADLFVLSSRHEGFPNALLEAGACGLYALANPCKGGIKEIIQEGINGEISEVKNHKQFAKEIESFLEKDFDKKLIRESIEKRYSQKVIMQQFKKLIQANA